MRITMMVSEEKGGSSNEVAGRQWLVPVILATQKAEIRRIKVQGQPRQIVHKTPSPK
jgi:hypothetical protein